MNKALHIGCIIFPSILFSFSAAAQVNSYQRKFNPTACDSAAAMQSGTFTKTEDATAFNWDNDFVAEMNKRTDPLVSITKQAFPGVKGFNAQYLRQMHNGSFVHDGPKGYDLNVLFLPFGCIYTIDPVTKKSVPTGKFSKASETGTWLYYYINNPALFFISHKKMMIDGKPHEVYGTFPVSGEWKGMEVYGSHEFFTDETWTEQGNVWLMITRPNEKAFLPITRKQYLEGKLLEYEEQYQKDAVGLNSRKKIINDYLSTAPADSLNLPAILYGYRDTDKCEEWFKPKRPNEGGSKMVVANHAYWRLDEPRAAPQIILVKFRYQMGDWNSVMIKKQFEKNFPVEKLQTLLDH